MGSQAGIQPLGTKPTSLLCLNSHWFEQCQEHIASRMQGKEDRQVKAELLHQKQGWAAANLGSALPEGTL